MALYIIIIIFTGVIVILGDIIIILINLIVIIIMKTIISIISVTITTATIYPPLHVCVYVHWSWRYSSMQPIKFSIFLLSNRCKCSESIFFLTLHCATCMSILPHGNENNSLKQKVTIFCFDQQWALVLITFWLI